MIFQRHNIDFFFFLEIFKIISSLFELYAGGYYEDSKMQYAWELNKQIFES